MEIGCLVVPPKELWDGSLRRYWTRRTRPAFRCGRWGGAAALACGGITVACLQPAASGCPGAGKRCFPGAYRLLGLLCHAPDGDVEGQGERLLTERLTQTYDVLKVAHHGSRNSTSEEFLAAAGPSVALISAGRDNRYGHPHEETLERLTGAGGAVFETARGGAVTVRTDGRRMTVTTFL